MNKLRIDFFATIAAALASAVLLVGSTYAWYVSNNTVTAETTSISATTNGFILQIATAEEGAQHGGNSTSLAATDDGHIISPSSTNNLEDWYVSRGWNSDGLVTSYAKAEVDEDGQYMVGSQTYYAYVMSEYILYTITQTGFADVYLDASEGSPITVTATGTATSQTIPNSMRVAIATVNDEDVETLRVVYAPSAVSGTGNDANAIADTWTYVDGVTPEEVTYPYIYGTTYTDQNGGNWAAVKSGDEYTPPASNGQKIAEAVDYDGLKVRVYIWMEGTDADCVNNEAAADEAYYNVTVKFAGVSAS